MKKQKVTNFNKDNILGWSEEDFRDVICTMCSIKMSLNEPLTPLMARTYLNESQQWHRERIGLTKENLKQEEIKRLEEKLEQLKNEK